MDKKPPPWSLHRYGHATALTLGVSALDMSIAVDAQLFVGPCRESMPPTIGFSQHR